MGSLQSVDQIVSSRFLLKGLKFVLLGTMQSSVECVLSYLFRHYGPKDDCHSTN